MFSGRNANGTQHIVGTGNVGRLAVYGASPARIVYLAQHNNTAITALHLIGKTVGLVAREFNSRRRIALQSIGTKDVGKLAIHHSHTGKVRTAQSRQFGIGIGHISHLVHEPSVAQSPGIQHRQLAVVLQADNGILRVQHVQHREQAVATARIQTAFALENSLVEHLHLRLNVRLDKLLITAQLGRMVTANALVVVRRRVVVESTYTEIQHTIVSRILTNNPVGITHRESLLVCLWPAEHTIVEITLVHAPHVNQAKHNDASHHRRRLQLPSTESQQQNRTNGNNHKAAQSIGSEHRTTHLAHVGKNPCHHLLRNVARTHILLHVSLIRRGNIIAEEHVGHKPEEQSHTTRQGKRNRNVMHTRQMVLPATQTIRVLNHLLQCQHGKHRNSKLRNNQYARHRTELVVHRNVVQKEVCQPHKILAPRQHNAQRRSSQQAPPHRTLHHKEAQPEEHQHESTDINRAARAGLLTPILRKGTVKRRKGRVRMLHRRFIVGQKLACSALCVRHKQRPGLANAVTPHGDIASFQSAVGLVGRVFCLLG